MKNELMASVFRFFLLVFFCSCSVGDQDSPLNAVDLYQIQGPGYRFTLDPVKYRQLDFNRKDLSLCQVQFEIKGIKRSQGELALEIERPKGCNAVYELVWDGQWQESSPRRMQLYLTGIFTTCTPTTETEIDLIKIDLTKAIREAPTDLFTIYLREHCSFRDFNCVGNCDLKI